LDSKGAILCFHKIIFPPLSPLDQAARQYDLSKKMLTQQTRVGKIQAIQLPSPYLLVAAENYSQDYQTKDEIISSKFAHLRGQTINPYSAEKIRYPPQ
jgi:hypothetical protein